MPGDRISLLPCAPCFSRPLARPARSTGLPPAIVARRYELETDPVGRLSYYSNIEEFATHEPPVVLLHGVHVGAGCHEMRRLFDGLRDQRSVYALDLPGFGHSDSLGCGYTPELYVSAIEQLAEVAKQETGRPVDLVAVSLSAEFAAKVAATRSDLVRSLVMIRPTGFGSSFDQTRLERLSRIGQKPLSVSIAQRLGLSALLYRTLLTELSLHCLLPGNGRAQDLRYRSAAARRPGAEVAALALLGGELYPRGNPQAVYTRVHCPTLIMTDLASRGRYGALSRFVKWRELFTAVELPTTSLEGGEAAQAVLGHVHGFWSKHESQDPPHPSRQPATMC